LGDPQRARVAKIASRVPQTLSLRIPRSVYR
jgi:hypothetical protein